MLRRSACALLLIVLTFTVAGAEEFLALIGQIKDDKVTFKKITPGQPFNPFKIKDRTLPVAQDIKVFKAKRNRTTRKIEADQELRGGIKAPELKDIPENGLRSHIVTNESGKTIKELRILFRAKKADP